MNENDRLDKINLERVETTKQRVAHAIKLCNNPVACLAEGRVIDTAVHDIAHAVNLLEAAVEEMRWACEHFDWNNEVCDEIDSACMDFGRALAILTLPDEDEYDPVFAAADAENGMSKLAKALATLIRWFDDEADVSEV